MQNILNPIKYREGRKLLFYNSLQSIPFNAIMSFILAIYLWYNNAPKDALIVWWSVMLLISLVRIIHAKIVIKKDLFDSDSGLQLRLFVFFTLLTGLNWTALFFILNLNTNELHLYMIILVYGGMVAGSTTSLSVYFPAFVVYIFSIFLPVIAYNFYLRDLSHVILAVMLTLFLMALLLIAKSTQGVLRKVFYLTEQNQGLIEELEKLSVTDALTGLYNRRHFSNVLEKEYNRAKRNKQSFALVAIDIDNFKLINDNCGHPFGDTFLEYTAKFLKKYFRRVNDVVFRMGGDEFNVLLLNTKKEDVLKICNELKDNFKVCPKFDYDLELDCIQDIVDKVTMSMGVVYIPHDTSVDLEDIVEQADRILYRAKREGKNQVIYTVSSKDKT